jgi:hypothetical protein
MSKNKIICDNTANGTQTFYHIVGYGAFYLTAVSVNGQITGNIAGSPGAAAAANCSAKGGKCFFGKWVEQLASSSGGIDPTGTNFGASVVQFAG